MGEIAEDPGGSELKELSRGERGAGGSLLGSWYATCRTSPWRPRRLFLTGPTGLEPLMAF